MHAGPGFFRQDPDKSDLRFSTETKKKVAEPPRHQGHKEKRKIQGKIRWFFAHIGLGVLSALGVLVVQGGSKGFVGSLGPWPEPAMVQTFKFVELTWCFRGFRGQSSCELEGPTGIMPSLTSAPVAAPVFGSKT
jgi:hypothetical protein